jgi:two-component system sensor histidine kinase/response regulator
MAAGRRTAHAVKTSTGRSPASILVVDDRASKRLAIKAALLPLGHSIVEADSGIAALRCVMAQDFAAILLDVRMPVMDGFETAALIRQRASSEMTPIIFVTAHGSDEIVNTDIYIEGAVDFIFAPVVANELRAKVSVLVKADELAAEARDVQRSADQLRLLTDAAPVGIFQTDSRNSYVYTNPRWTELTGIPAHEAAGRGWDTILGSEERAAVLAEFPDGALDRAELCHRFEIGLPDSDSRIVLLTSKCIPTGDGRIAGWVGTLADVTAEAGAEAAMADARDEANEASRLKSDFLTNMSHEIRTPMNGVIGMTDLLLETELDVRQRDYAQTVRNSGEALLTIINDILDFSKVEAGKLEVESIEFNLPTVVDDVVDLLAGPAQTKGLELVAVVESSVPAVVTGDPGRVRQVLTNLIGNAIKFTQTGEIVVRVTSAEHVDAESVVRFEVSDTGDGIEAEKLAMVFQPFVQSDTSTSRKYGGTGLGLAISSQLISLMGGDCGVSSRHGSGSEFWFTVRVQAEPGQARHGLLPTDPGLVGVTALIVDDNATQRGVLSDYLSDWGMTASSAGSGEEALVDMRTAVAEHRPYAVALLDRSMSGMDGLELKDAIVADPDLTARLVLVTDLGQERDLGDVAESPGGIRASLSKPVHREELLTCLRVALGLQEAVADSAEQAPERPPVSGKPGRLLLVEDNLINQKVAVAMLASGGYHVDTALNGVAALQAIADHPYDAILMDCQMPEMNGYEATAAIRAREGADRHTPIIAMTAGARREDQVRCLAEGMDSYLAKPVSKEALLALVARSLKNGTAVRPAELHEERLPALDAGVVGRLERLGEESGEDLMGRLAALFLADADTRVAALRQAVAERDAAATARSAHALGGAGANLGATGLARLCARLELGGENGNLVGSGPLLDAVGAELARVRSALSAGTGTPTP